MKRCISILWGVLLSALAANAQTSGLQFPKRIEAGTAFSVRTSGSGSGTLYIVGPANVLKRKIQLGESIAFGPDDLPNAGHYAAFLKDGSSEQAQFDVTPSKASRVSFIAKPSRLPVKIANGVSGVAYIFDTFGNLVLKPENVTFELSDSSGKKQTRADTSKNGVAWVRMDSAPKAVQEVPGDPCSIRMTARASGQRVVLQTEPVRDCSGNPVPDGTIVTFTESYSGSQSTVDVPLKRGIARTELPAHPGATISVAAGVVMGNEIRWSGGL